MSTDPDTLKLTLVESASNNDDLDFLSDKLEQENPGKTIVLNAATREIIIASDRSDEIASKLKSLSSDVITLFIGGPHKEALAFHHFCSSPHA